MSDLLDAIQQPEKVAIWMCEVQSNQSNFISQGNAKAAAAAKAAAKQEIVTTCLAISETAQTPTADLRESQHRKKAVEEMPVYAQGRGLLLIMTTSCVYQSTYFHSMLS